MAMKASPLGHWAFRKLIGRRGWVVCMIHYVDELTITTDKTGAREYAKVSYPIRYGVYDEIRTRDYIFQFDLRGEIKYIQGRREDWPNPGEWLKRTQGNDWIYYSSGDYNGIVGRFGEYYFPCLSYPSNSIMADKPFLSKGVQQAFFAAGRLLERISRIGLGAVPAEIGRFIARGAAHDEKALVRRARQFHRIIGGRVSVLPPDARHADYEVIPLILADGCLYNCGFCSVKAGRELSARSRTDVAGQIAGLKRFYGADLRNYNALFLGQHDALAVGADLIECTLESAYDSLGFEHSFMQRPRLFLFGSADSLLGAKERVFQLLDRMPFDTYINIGLESSDAATLQFLNKPVSVGRIRDAFARMAAINRGYERIEVSANFVIGLDLPPGHLSSLSQLAKDTAEPFCGKGHFYISPMVRDSRTGREEKRALLAQFDRVKTATLLPTSLYLIQRL